MRKLLNQAAETVSLEKDLCKGVETDGWTIQVSGQATRRGAIGWSIKIYFR
jgi:putative aminopeptidase FrvX